MASKTSMVYLLEAKLRKSKIVPENQEQESVNIFLNFLIKLGNILAILPVCGLTGTPSEAYFTWKSFKCLYTFIAIMLFLINTILCIVHWTSVTFNFDRLASQMYHINALSVLILYLHLAKKWPKFIGKWCKIDQSMSQAYGSTKSLQKRTTITSVIILAATIGEFFMWVLYKVADFKDKKGRPPSYKEYYTFVYPEFFLVIPFNFVAASIATLSSLWSGLIWSFNDLFIIIVSSAVALRFRQITERLAQNATKTKPNEFWIEIRADYDKLVQLVQKIDKKISYIVLLSFSANIFFLLIRLSNTVGNMNYDFEIVYYLFAFALLISRLVAVSLYAAWINDESKEPVNILNSVPSATYNIEIRRFLLQISFDDVAISGSKMFKITRGLILSVAGAIVSYELVVVQFNNSMLEVDVNNA